MIYVWGDCHGNFEAVQRMNRFCTPEDIIIQVGDLSTNISTKMIWEQLYPSVVPTVLYIDGNHEDHDLIDTWPKHEPYQVAKNLFYVPRGMVLTLEGFRIGFLGGAESVDKYRRNLEGQPKTWWAQEGIRQEDVDRLVKNAGGKDLDFLITHAPPNSAKMGMFPKIDTEKWDLPSNWTDQSCQFVDVAMVLTNPKKVFCGHMHKSVKVNNVQILAIDEVVPLYDLYTPMERTAETGDTTETREL